VIHCVLIIGIRKQPADTA